ncbi:hypothetical protein [Streptomyces sp. ME18-1-4]|uniref:hypothetical protein n=1 Tax=Streptomyces sp. ME18-1-4 TaxID=3028685 RepID=UPI0029BA5B83|nr:hypothetical protein [Streptomyces sp. ME18-1-4]MDX3248175.1 hypothetical protein [Streptomyces sp. ME18-1-4]
MTKRPEDRVEDRVEAGALGDGQDEEHRRTGALRCAQLREPPDAGSVPPSPNPLSPDASAPDMPSPDAPAPDTLSFSGTRSPDTFGDVGVVPVALAGPTLAAVISAAMVSRAAATALT